MAIKAIVFDFDGTLIDSNRLKYDAFFELFPQDDFHKRIISEVLAEHLEETRYIILREILTRSKEMSKKIDNIETRISELAARYNDKVVAGAKKCKEKPSATRILEDLSKRYKLYLFSTTPELSLKDVVKHRKWDSYFCDIFGYPKQKVDMLSEIMSREHLNPNEVLVVGDRESDRLCASSAGCRFFRTDKDGLLERLTFNLRQQDKRRKIKWITY